jgi:hypothetical protein
MDKPIVFNSKSSSYFLLSNFYGNCEINYMKNRFNDPEVKELLDDFAICDKDKFIFYLKILQPGKKWTQAKLDYWFKTINGKKEPIRGILAKLVGGAVKGTPAMKKRLQIVKSLAGLSKDFELSIKENQSFTEKKELMYKCLIEKFNKESFKKVLVSTGNSVLHEKPLRGIGNNWTFPGDDWLGKILIKIRDEL